MSSGRKVDYTLKNLPEMISEQSGIDKEKIEQVIDRVMKRITDRARRDQQKIASGDMPTDSVVELIIMQYTFGMLDTLLSDVTIDDIHAARKYLGMPEKKLMN